MFPLQLSTLDTYEYSSSPYGYGLELYFSPAWLDMLYLNFKYVNEGEMFSSSNKLGKRVVFF